MIISIWTTAYKSNATGWYTLCWNFYTELPQNWKATTLRTPITEIFVTT